MIYFLSLLMLVSSLANAKTITKELPARWAFTRVIPQSCEYLNYHLNQFNASEYIHENPDNRLGMWCEDLAGSKSIALLYSKNGVCHNAKGWQNSKLIDSWVADSDRLLNRVAGIFKRSNEYYDMSKLSYLFATSGIRSAHDANISTLQTAFYIEMPKCAKQGLIGNQDNYTSLKNYNIKTFGKYAGHDAFGNRCELEVSEKGGKNITNQKDYYYTVAETTFYQPIQDALVQTKFKFVFDYEAFTRQLNSDVLRRVYTEDTHYNAVGYTSSYHSYDLSLNIAADKSPIDLSIEHHKPGFKKTELHTYRCSNLNKIE